MNLTPEQRTTRNEAQRRRLEARASLMEKYPKVYAQILRRMTWARFNVQVGSPRDKRSQKAAS